MSKKVIMLSKADCTKCAQANLILEKVLNNKYNNHIQFVKKEEHAEVYEKLVAKHNVMSLPVFIAGEHVLKDVTPTTLTGFLKTYASQ
jgi:glutaredoxin